MKRLYILLTTLLLTLSLVSCDFLSSETIETLENISTQTEIISTTTASTTAETTSSVETTEISTDGLFRPTDFSLLQDELEEVGIPSIGSPKVLVFAVDFSDYPNTSYGLPISDLETVFNGSSSEMDFESINSFYQKSSFGKLNLTADIYGYYRAEHPSSYYEEEYRRYWATDPITGQYIYDDVTIVESDIVYEVLTYYDDQIDYSDYDYNHDGLIDGVYIIYTHPVSFESGSDLWWAYQDWYGYDHTGAKPGEEDYFDGVAPEYLCWSGMEFITEGEGILDARTLIHESGHMMGLDDYYDYSDQDSYNMGGLAGADMMDSGYGDHGPFSKLLLGWITPIVVETDEVIDILPYANSGDVILVTDDWNNSIFDEYLLISLYTPTGLYADDSSFYFPTAGISIYHVSAQIGKGYDTNSYYWTIFNYNNTDTEHKVVKYIEADMDNSVEDREMLEFEDLFQTGDILGENIYSNYQWYDGNYIGFDISIDSAGYLGATITITYNNQN